jgi:hypothetical protein
VRAFHSADAYRRDRAAIHEIRQRNRFAELEPAKLQRRVYSTFAALPSDQLSHSMKKLTAGRISRTTQRLPSY